MGAVFRHWLWLLAMGLATGGACASADLEAELKSRYQLQRVAVSKDEGGRATGQFNLRGNLTEAAPARARTLVAGGQAPSAEVLARAFAANNLQLFDIADAEQDLRLSSSQQDASGNHHLRFQRMINGLLLEGMELLFHVSGDGQVSGANGNIVRIAPELRKYLEDNPQLPRQKEERILDAIASDLEVAVADFEVADLQLLAVNQPPFVVWKLDVKLKKRLAHFRYRISDADAGILQKRDLVHMKFGKRYREGAAR